MDADLVWINTELRCAKNEFLNRLYDHQRPLINELMDKYGVPEEHRGALAHGILLANVELWETFGSEHWASMARSLASN